MFATLKTLAATLAMPLPGALLLALIGGWWVIRGSRRLGGIAVSFGVLLLALSAWAPVADRLLGPLEHAHPPIESIENPDAFMLVVVLGGGWAPHAPWPATARLNDSSTSRLLEGLRLVQQLPESRLLVSGASRRPDEVPIAHGYASVAQALGVSGDRLIVLDRPTDTAQEAYAVRELLERWAAEAGDSRPIQDQQFLLVTSASHMPRAMRHFERAGLAPVAAPMHFLSGRLPPRRLAYWVPSAENLRKTERAVYERLGLLALEWDH
ncbi:MAG: YdcF family protein [Gammaproteobacteria bacterium]|nr:YdcF family protein [Gammaproteobacteria bacterium]